MKATLTTPAVETAVHRRSGWALVGVLAGGALAFAWSYVLVDDVIGTTVADSLLGQDARQTVLVDSLGGVAFALVSGLAGTLTACNIALFGALPTVAAGSVDRRSRVASALTALGWLGAGLMAVAGAYGFLAVSLGSNLPQLSTATIGNGMPVRLIQSVVVFGLIGLSFAYMGLASLALVRDPFASRPRLRLVVLGALIGGFLVGRPYPLFAKLLDFAVDSGNPLLGSVTMMFQSLGNIVVFAALALLVSVGMGDRGVRWLAQPNRAAVIGGVSLLMLGTFLLLYWDVRLPAVFGYGWFPTAPWNS